VSTVIAAPPAATEYLEIPRTQIERWERQPRRHFDPAALKELAADIAQQGILEPPLVRPVWAPCEACGGTGTRPIADLFGGTLPLLCEACDGAGRVRTGHYQLVTGERRWRAAEIAGLDVVPVRVREMDDRSAMLAALSENLQRRDLNPIEEALGIQELVAEGMKQTEIAERLGCSQPNVASTLALLRLPEDVQQLITEGKLKKAHGQILVRYAAWPQACSIMADLAARKGTPQAELEKGVPFGWDVCKAGHARELGFGTLFEWEHTCKGCDDFRKGAYAHTGYCFRPPHFDELQAAAKARKEQAQKTSAEELRAQYLAAVAAREEAPAEASPEAPPALVRLDEPEPDEEPAAEVCPFTGLPEHIMAGAVDMVRQQIAAEEAAANTNPSAPVPSVPPAPALPDTDGLGWGTYRRPESGKMPAGCRGEGCEHYVVMTTRGANPGPCCLNVACYQPLADAEGAARREARLGQIAERYARAAAILDAEDPANSPRLLAIRARAALYNIGREHLERACEELGLPAALAPVLQVHYGRYATEAEQLDLLAGLSPTVLHRLPILAQLLDETGEYAGREYTDWLLGEARPDPAKLNAWTNTKDRKAIDAARVAAGLPPIGRPEKKAKSAAAETKSEATAAESERTDADETDGLLAAPLHPHAEALMEIAERAYPPAAEPDPLEAEAAERRRELHAIDLDSGRIEARVAALGCDPEDALRVDLDSEGRPVEEDPFDEANDEPVFEPGNESDECLEGDEEEEPGVIGASEVLRDFDTDVYTDAEPVRCVRCGYPIPEASVAALARYTDDQAAQVMRAQRQRLTMASGAMVTGKGTWYCPQCVLDGVQVCRECGCTDECACDGGCAWVEPDLCSACARPAEGAPATEEQDLREDEITEEDVDAMERLADLGDGLLATAAGETPAAVAPYVCKRCGCVPNQTPETMHALWRNGYCPPCADTIEHGVLPHTEVIEHRPGDDATGPRARILLAETPDGWYYAWEWTVGHLSEGTVLRASGDPGPVEDRHTAILTAASCIRSRANKRRQACRSDRERTGLAGIIAWANESVVGERPAETPTRTCKSCGRTDADANHPMLRMPEMWRYDNLCNACAAFEEPEEEKA
jgi:ParB/RepB/Spo0J family partition protein